ncbi:TPA: GNAT family N-acetyltransferase [Enterobacter mori]|uniref:GNAT family N-acetyltransferase n=2 Tax=Enterobacteriaceae TaxID=543 RepID=A0ABU7UJ50_LELAM|nr:MULTISPECIES: GNAT family N-acetyltransferase [Enterobacter]CAH8250134.1 Uncharacterised protein [Enterobacter ludwigii]HDR2833910.1 GNAT family N-acetyltransferase [Enterobacter mori]
MRYKLKKNIKNSKNDFLAFNDLAVKVFGLSFEKWYDSGYWRDKYFTYTYFDDEKAVANVSASKINTMVDGKPKLYIQIGTVMTDPKYRNMGLSRKLMDELFKDFNDNCDGIYLYGNNTVLDFYPKFGFVTATEYQYTMQIAPKPYGFVELDMSDKVNIDLLEVYYNKGNPFSQRPMLDNFGLAVISCTGYFRDCTFYGEVPEQQVFYSELLKAVVIASFKGEEMLCYDIFCDYEGNLNDIIKSASMLGTKMVSFGFMPKDTTDCQCRVLENEDQLFVLKYKENMFFDNKMMLPLLSHA